MQWQYLLRGKQSLVPQRLLRWATQSFMNWMRSSWCSQCSPNIRTPTELVFCSQVSRSLLKIICIQRWRMNCYVPYILYLLKRFPVWQINYLDLFQIQSVHLQSWRSSETLLSTVLQPLGFKIRKHFSSLIWARCENKTNTTMPLDNILENQTVVGVLKLSALGREPPASILIIPSARAAY